MSDNHFIITISREFCSGGQRVAAKLAADLGVKMYDEDLLSKASEESGISKELFESHDEKPTNSFLYSLVMDTYSFNYAGNAYSEMPINQQIFLAQFETIKKIAAKGRIGVIRAHQDLRQIGRRLEKYGLRAVYDHRHCKLDDVSLLCPFAKRHFGFDSFGARLYFQCLAAQAEGGLALNAFKVIHIEYQFYLVGGGNLVVQHVKALYGHICRIN